MDAFEAAKIDENREPVLEVKARAKAKADLLERMDKMQRVPVMSPYADIDESLLLELCYRKDLRDAPEWTPMQRRIALTIVHDDEMAALMPAPPTLEQVQVVSMANAVPIGPAKVPRPRPPAPRRVEDLPASANGHYVVTKGGKCALPGAGLQLIREGKILSPSYGKAALQALLDFGLDLAPQIPVDALPEPEAMPTWDVEVGDAGTAVAFVRVQVALPPGIPPSEFAEWVQRSLAQSIAPEQVEEPYVPPAAEEVATAPAAPDPADVLTEPSVLREVEAELAADPDPAETEDQAARSRAAAETDPQTPRGRRGRKA